MYVKEQHGSQLHNKSIPKKFRKNMVQVLLMIIIVQYIELCIFSLSASVFSLDLYKTCRHFVLIIPQRSPRVIVLASSVHPSILPSVRPYFLSVRNHISVPIGQI